MPRESAYSRLLRHFHTHPQGRLHELAFFWGLALLLGGGAFVWWRAGGLSTPLFLIVVIIALCLALFSLLPQKKVKAPPRKPGKRGEIQALVQAGKKEGRRKRPDPPVK